LKLTIG